MYQLNYQIYICCIIYISLMSQQTHLNVNVRQQFVSNRFNRRFGLINGLFVATLITGTNWYIQKKWAQAKCAKQDVIIQRINNGETTTLQEIANVDNELQAASLEGKLVEVTGEIQPGRFIVKKNKGNQDGYVILAPYIVSSEWRSSTPRSHPLLSKYMLNLGWVPKTFKHRIRQASAIDIIPLNDLPDHLTDEDNPRIPITSTVKAFVRRGEQQDNTNGIRNEIQNHIYNFIDLNLLANVFGNVNHESRFVYLDRAVVQGEEDSFPFPKTADNLKEELEGRKARYENTKNLATISVGVLSYVGALLAM